MGVVQRVESNDAKAAYEGMAPIYDDFTAQYDYELWFAALLPELKRQGLVGHRLLDVGCGTGKSFMPMLRRGWEVTACDISPAMLELARAKVGDSVRLRVADMRALPVFGEFDLVWALDDVLNYLLTVEELERALVGMRTNLAPEGLLAFDLNTLHSYRTFFAGTETRELEGGRRLVWRGRARSDTPPGSISEATIAVESNGSPGAGVEPTLHRQRHFMPEEILHALDVAGLGRVAVFGHGLDTVFEQPVDERRHTKMVFITGPK